VKTPAPPRRAALAPQELSAELSNLSRGPFIVALGDFLGCQPTLESIQIAADKSPDRWVQAITMLAKLAGYHDKLELSGSIGVEIAMLSDADLITRLESVEGELIEGEYTASGSGPPGEDKEKMGDPEGPPTSSEDQASS
jgi:hypothetical protein